MLKRLNHLIIYLLVLITASIVKKLSFRTALRLGENLGKLLATLIKKRRDIALKNLQLAFGEEKSQNEINQIAIKCFENIGKNLLEMFWFSNLSSQELWKYVYFVGKDNIEKAFEKGKGIIVFIPHFGNWELLALAYGGSEERAAAIAFPLKNSYLNKLIENYRSRLGLKLIPKKNAIKNVIRLLGENYGIGFLADQDAGRSGIFIDFFGKPASFERSPIILALRTNSSIIFSIDVRQPDDKHIVFIEAIKVRNSGNVEEDIAFNISKIANKLEEYIRLYPSQWLWIHNRWKTQPNKK